MSDVSIQRYDFILKKLGEARLADNSKALKLWRGKLEKWQQAYGAYVPIRRV